MPDLNALIDDLVAEHEALDDIVDALDEKTWDAPTPAVPWSVRDQISHLAFFDEQALLAVEDPDGFNAKLGEIVHDIQGFVDAPLEKGRSIPGPDVLGWWREARTAMVEAFRRIDPSVRVPWYGPPMSPASFITARLMETWAHGQDVVDALGARREPTARLKHVAFLGVRARRNSYAARGMEMPEGDVAVELTGPSGEMWAWNVEADDRVRGSAMDFCLVVTQRRHLDDTDLEIEGDRAREWMSIAQAFAGPPGEGRKPGQFARS